MKREETQLRAIHDRTEGQCHICRKRLSFRNYGLFGKRGACEIEHSVAQARGGTDHGNNLFAAHISCNRSKGYCSSRTARRQHCYQCAPYSARKKKRNAAIGAGIGFLRDALTEVAASKKSAAINPETMQHDRDTYVT